MCVNASVSDSQHARDALVSYYLANKQVPESLSAAGIDQSAPNGVTMSLNPKGMILTVTSKGHKLVFTPKQDGQGNIMWACGGEPGVRPAQLPPSCR